jgi:large subunit ribosomal protein L17
MRHGKKVMHLGRKKAHRKSMLSNMACSLIDHKSINTTLTKAKALKIFIEPIITKAKDDTTHNRRLVFGELRSKDSVSELFGIVSNKVADRPGGYTRIIKMGNRLGDNADMALIELVDFNEVYSIDSDNKKKSTRRRRSKKSPEEKEVLSDSDKKDNSKSILKDK